MAIPEHLVPTVAHLIATDRGPRQESSPEGSFLNGWTEEALRSHYGQSSTNMRAFLVYLAAHAGEEVQSTEVAKSLGLSGWNAVAGMIGAAQRRASNRYSREHGPWTRRWVGDGQVRLKMPNDIAEIVLDEAAKQGDR